MREVKPTQKPVPSSDIKDLFFNSGLLDIWATSLEKKYIDRFGNCHLTAAGMEWIFNELVTKFKIESEQALLAAGYASVGTFQEGAEVVSRNGTVLWKLPDGDGDYYRWDGDLPKQVSAGSAPQSTGGIGKGAWVSVGDASLRSDIKANSGASIIGTESGGTVQDEINKSNEKIDLIKTPTQKVDFLFKSERKFNNNLFVEIQEYLQGTYHYAPTSVVLPSGRILSVYTVKVGNNIDPGQDSTRMYLQSAISDDDGETFTVKDLVNKGAGFATSESVLVHNHIDGNLYCFYTSMKGVTGWGHSEKGIDENNSSQIEYVISRDSGETWSTPINITADVKPSDAYFCSIAPTQCAYDKGKLVIPFYFLKQKGSWINEAYITLDQNGVFKFGEIVRDEYQDDTVGRSGGEIGFGNFSDGTLFAIERAFDDTSKSFRIAQQKLLLKDVKNKKWYVKGQFATSDCQASFLRVGLEHGFNKEYLFVVAPIGDNGALNGRRNMRIFDCSDDFSNPKNLALIAIQENIATEYSTTQLLPTGAFISMWHGRQWLIHSTVYTVNRKMASKYMNQPSHSGYKTLDISTGNYLNDLFNGEIVKSNGSGEFYAYNSGSFSNINTAKTKSIDSVTDILNANEASIFYLNAGSNGSQIGEISGGYTGMTVKILVTTSSSVVDLVRAKSGVGSRNRIMYSDSVDGNKYRMTGGVAARSSMVALTKTDSGWYLDRVANAS
ncbi:hypothetical protein [Providencia alcalifaciens]|uniref:tail fiber/spike domain-containing protein n=1 Tax=Providencia alcalifaciens TaxID=126385 RepID=UPI0032D9BB63